MEPEDYFRMNDFERWSKKRISAFILNRVLDHYFDTFQDVDFDTLEIYTEKLFKYMIMNGVCDPRDIDEAVFIEIIES
jgi:hypothetical protein